MSNLRKRGVRLKRFNSVTTATTTQTQLLPDDLTTTPSPPVSPPSSTSQSDLSTPTLSASASSDSPSPISPSHPSPAQPQRLGSASHIGSDVDGHWPDDMEAVQRDEHIDHSLASLSSLAPRIPTQLHHRLAAQLPVYWAQWVRLPLNVRCAIVSLSLLYGLLFSIHTHAILLLFYAFLLFALLSVRDELTSVARRRGLLSVLPTSVLPYVSEYTVMELSHLLLSSTLTSDVLLLLCFRLSEAEQRVVLQRLPAPYSDWLVRRGLVNLLPETVQQLLYPAPHSQQQRSTATVVALADGDETEAQEEKQREEGTAKTAEEEKKEGMHEPGLLLDELRIIPSDMMEHKYDEEERVNHIDNRLRDWPSAASSGTRFTPLAPRVAPTPVSLLSFSSTPFSRQSSMSSTLPPPSPAPSDDELDAASVTLSSVIDRQLSSSLSALFRSWAKQSYTALYDATTELLPNVVSSSSSLHFFVPLAASIVGLHVVSSHGRVREVMRRSQPYVVDGVVCVSALLAAHHLYVLLVEGFNRRREARRLQQSGDVAVSMDDGGWGVRVWILYVYRKCRGERGVFVSGVVLLCWMMYLAKARTRVWQWLETRELHRRGALAQLANRLA